MGIPLWRLGGQYFSIAFNLGQMSRYLDLVQTTIFEQPQEYKKFIENLVEEWTDDENAEWYEETDDEQLQELNEDLSRIFHSSFLVSWYSLVETYLLGFCDTLKLPDNVNNRIRGIDRAKDRLWLGKGYSIDKLHWDELKKIQKLRNQIVHNGGRLRFNFKIKPVQRRGYAKIVAPIHGSEEIIWIHLNKNIDRNTCKYAERHKLIWYEGKLFLSPKLTFSRHLVEFGKQLFKKFHDDLYEIEVSSKKKP